MGENIRMNIKIWGWFPQDLEDAFLNLTHKLDAEEVEGVWACFDGNDGSVPRSVIDFVRTHNLDAAVLVWPHSECNSTTLWLHDGLTENDSWHIFDDESFQISVPAREAMENPDVLKQAFVRQQDFERIWQSEATWPESQHEQMTRLVSDPHKERLGILKTLQDKKRTKSQKPSAQDTVRAKDHDVDIEFLTA